MIERIFHPIGQGAFYTEAFDSGLKVVYDCGTSTDLSLLHREIDQAFNENEVIDIVFISHLHADHVNGLEHLISRCHVKNIILPNIDVHEKIQILFFNEYVNHLTDFIEQLIVNPMEIHNIFDVNIILVNAYEDKTVEEEFDIEQLSHGQNISSGTKLTSKTMDSWIYLPFNFRNESRHRRLLQKLMQNNLTMESIDNFKDIWRDEVQRQQLIEVFKGIPGDMNTNSMTVYSGPDKRRIFRKVVRCTYRYCYYSSSLPRPFHHMSYKVGCLYFGDYDASGNQKWEKLYSAYQNYWDYIGIVQVPHHGSYYNYNDSINIRSGMINIISAGRQNNYGHPHGSTLRKILLKGGLPFIVSEDKISKFECIVRR